jgi:hypothetical protein
VRTILHEFSLFRPIWEVIGVEVAGPLSELFLTDLVIITFRKTRAAYRVAIDAIDMWRYDICVHQSGRRLPRTKGVVDYSTMDVIKIADNGSCFDKR